MYGLSDLVINDISGVFAGEPNIREVLIFGSRAKGNYTDNSDIDLALKGRDLTMKYLLNLSLKMDDLDPLYKIDMVVYDDSIYTPLKEHIDRVGKVFYLKDAK